MLAVCGEALVDMLPAACAGGRGFVPRPGGSPCNVAVGLARLDVPATFVGRVSTDPLGRLIRRHLASNGVDLRHVSEGPELTTLGFVHDPDGADVQYTFYAENSADRNLTVADLPETLGPEVEALHFGSISLVLEPAASAFAALMRRERGARLICLDPNVRPLLIERPAEYRARLETLVAMADLVKLSVADSGWLYPGTPVDVVAERWRALGPALVLVTLGPNGSTAHGAGGAASAPAVPVAVVDTVGAGDAFSAASLAWLHRHGRLDGPALAAMGEPELASLLRYANLASALTCARAGADPPRLQELEQTIA
jgi:fructokinase